MLETSNQIHKLITSNKIILDPLRLALQFNGSPDSTIIDDFLCNQYGIYCELNQKKCITYAISPYMSKNVSSLETLFSALKSLDVASILRGEENEIKISPSFDLSNDDDEIIDTLSINLQRDLSYLSANIQNQANKITKKLSKNLINQ